MEIEQIETGAEAPSAGKRPRGRPAVDVNREQFSMMLPTVVMDKLRAQALSEGNSLAAVTRRLLSAALGF